MITGILGTKVGMSQILDENGKVLPVTYVSIAENEIVQIKTAKKDGYNAVVLGSNPYHKPSKTKKFKNIKEFKVESVEGFKIGDKVSVSDFSEEKSLHVTGISKGKGFQGPVKRRNRSIARKSHGTKYIRHGSTMNSAITGRSKKGIKMAGQMGDQQVTVRNREIPVIDIENKVIAIKGPIPGANGGLVILRKA